MTDYEIALIHNGNTDVFIDLDDALDFIRKNWGTIYYLSMRKVAKGTRILKKLKGELPEMAYDDD